MTLFTWIVLGIVGVLALVSAVCWGIFIAADNPDWKKLATKVFRIALAVVLLYINVYIYMNMFYAVSGEKPVAAVVEPVEE